ncbi:MAG: hypothetical protein IT422_08645 [Pirellulaceae bacterium]|nr:hypothetical protein [Pirellulaceae bacterium]
MGSSSDNVIEELRALTAKQSAQIETQSAQIEKLTARIGELELQLAKAKKDSTTSSKPPSSDIAKPKPKQRPGRPKKPRQGGQPGHERHLREPLPPERVDETIEYEIGEAERQRLGLTPTGDFDSIQHIELPETPVHVTEHRLTVYRDADGNLYVPECPELKGPIFGPQMLAMIGWLKSVGHCSYPNTKHINMNKSTVQRFFGRRPDPKDSRASSTTPTFNVVKALARMAKPMHGKQATHIGRSNSYCISSSVRFPSRFLV